MSIDILLHMTDMLRLIESRIGKCNTIHSMWEITKPMQNYNVFPSIFYANATFFTFSCIYLNFSSLCKTTHYLRLNKTCYISLKNEIRQFSYISSMCTGFPYQNLLLFLNATKLLKFVTKTIGIDLLNCCTMIGNFRAKSKIYFLHIDFIY